MCNKYEIGQYATDSIRADFFAFAEKGNLQGNSESVLFAQVLVNGAQNLKLAERIGVRNIDNFKHPKMFLYQPNATESIPYPDSGAFNSVSLTRFVSKHTDFFFGVPGTIEVFDTLAEKFMAAHNLELDGIIAEAEALAPSVELKDKQNAQTYVKIMKKIKEAGVQYVKTETARLQSIIDSERLSDAKKSDIQKRLNIVHQFDRNIEEKEL